MNLPNKLTLLRIALIPVFIVFASVRAIPGGYLIACAVFGAAAYTDYLDGHIARKRGLVTDFGKFADPLADKILTTTAFVYMLVDGVCDPLVLVIIILREFAVSGLRMVAAGAQEGAVIAANIWGKTKTVLQIVTIVLYYFMAGVQHLLPPTVDVGHWPQIITWLLCWVVAAATLVSGIQTIWQNRRFIDTTK